MTNVALKCHYLIAKVKNCIYTSVKKKNKNIKNLKQKEAQKNSKYFKSNIT